MPTLTHDVRSHEILDDPPIWVEERYEPDEGPDRKILDRLIDAVRQHWRKARHDVATGHRVHREYLRRVSSDGRSPLITPATARKSWDLWLAVRNAVGSSMPVPSAATGPDGVMFYSWDNGEHHLEAEIFPDRDTEFFYRNRSTGELWGEDYSGGSLPAELLGMLKLFL
jgi:hypothetical protein